MALQTGPTPSGQTSSFKRPAGLAPNHRCSGLSSGIPKPDDRPFCIGSEEIDPVAAVATDLRCAIASAPDDLSAADRGEGKPVMSLLLIFVLFSTTGASENGRVELSTIVGRLGTSASTWKDVEFLDQHRCSAAPLIVGSLLRLPPVPPGKVGGALGRPDNWLSDRTSGLLRALRILTDHDEYGPITRREYAALPVYHEKPGGDGILMRDSLVRDLPPGGSRYFGYWLSRGTSFYAPATTQRAIKVQWSTYVRGFDCQKGLSKRRWDGSFFNG